MTEDPVTTGELGRRLTDLRLAIDTLAARVVTRDVFQVEQQRITEWLVRLDREHAELEQQVKIERDRNDERRLTRTEAERQQRVADRRLVYGAILAGVISVIVTFAGRLYGAS